MVLISSFIPGYSQIKVPNWIIPNDTWGLVDANNLFGGCMQKDNHQMMLNTDIQMLKRGMLFVVYDDDIVTPGPQTKIYMFSPPTTGPLAWNYDSPFKINAADQNKTLEQMGLSSYLIPLNIAINTDPGNKSNVYFDSTDNQFYKYDDTTVPGTYVMITPAAANISVKPQNGITSTNVQSALEEVAAKVAGNAQRYSTTVTVDGQVDFNVGFDLDPNSMVFYNGVVIDYQAQWTTGATLSDLKMLFETAIFDKIKVQK